MTKEQSDRVYTTLIELLADQLDLEVVEITKSNQQGKIIWRMAHDTNSSIR